VTVGRCRRLDRQSDDAAEDRTCGDDAIGHSDRSAITGSILVARRAGNHDAHSGHQQQCHRHRDVDDRIRGVDVKERLLHQSRHDQRTRDAKRDAGERKPAAVAEHHVHDDTRRCAERHADADLIRTGRHEVRHHAVHARAAHDER
jgi:hypothetical protein